jgi:hypothetical protein
MADLLAAVPEQFIDVWYLYDLMLIAVIGICSFILIFLRKRSNLIEAEKSMKSAKNLLRKAKTAPVRRRKFFLFSAKNVLNSAAYLYSLAMSEEDKYEYGKVIDSIRSAVERIDVMIKQSSNKTASEISDEIDALIQELF